MDTSLSKTSELLVETLTPRELDILALLAQNLSDREIAERLTLALSSVKWYARQIYGKLGVDNRREAGTKARQLRLLETRTRPNPLATNLPRQLSSFIGREKEIATLLDWVRRYPLVTMTGSGGVGKTRLALAAAARLLDDFRDGVWLVELAPLTDPKQALRAAANAVGLHEEPGHTLEDSLIFFFSDRQALLILDNAEHLVDEVARLANHLLQAAPGLKLLTTSRESLGVDGERVFRVPSLNFPAASGPETGSPLDDLLGYEAVHLFIDRAQAALPEFSVTPANLAAIVKICQRLDGIPLAIELAASRVVSLEVDQIAARLEHDFRMLAGGSRTAVERQRTLRATIEWSYNLLSEKERRLMRSLAVFSGGWTLSAAEAVCSDEVIPQEEVLDLLTRLADKSVVMVDRQPGKETRYRLLESLRHFAAEKLSESGEGEALRRRHCDWCVRLAETAGPQLFANEALIWAKRIRSDQDNLRSALEWSIRENGDPQAGLRIMVAMDNTFLGMDSAEVYQWYEPALAVLEGQAAFDPLFRAKVLINMATIRTYSEPLEAGQDLEDAVSYCQNLGIEGRLLMAWAMRERGSHEAFDLANLALGLHLEEESEAIVRDLGAEGKPDLACVLAHKVYILFLMNDVPGERACADEFVALCEELGNSLIWAHKQLGDIALRRGEYAQATRHYSEFLDFNQALGVVDEVSDLFRKLAEVERAQGHLEQALAYYKDSLKLAYEHGSRGGIEWVLICLGFNQIEVSRNQSQVEADQCLRRAARLFGAVQTMVEQEKNPLQVPVEIKPDYERSLAYLNEHLDPAALQAAWAAGRAMKVNQAVAYAMEEIAKD